ncbi:coiled-coil domain-containing protein 112-like [Frieseomelitta varia]|uniref:coiled-coil domain-containing protein 112-like n=1 Tax=Frieseomelitta varia TaxID=561572 RepID=UPI001CB69959|nr:coiled-coil domain-containing protein 112-like [Frieseomelitta varia]
MSASSGNSVKARSDTSRKRSTSAQKDLYMKPLLRLKQQEGILEKGLVTAIENMKIDANLVQDIMNQHRELSLERRNFLDAMHKNIEDIASELDSAKHIANNPEDLQKLDINTYKTKLIKLSRKLLDFERSCPIQTLTEEGDALSSELHELHFDLNKYEKAQENATLLSLSCKSKVDNKREKSEYKGADDFHDLVAVTGHTENWPMEDHLFFLKMRKTCENIPTLVAAIQKKFPDLSVETIVNHEAWYKQYADLREKQKAAVKEWRQRKVEKKKNMDEMDRKIEDHCEDEDCLNEVPEEEAIDTFKKTRPPARESRSTNSSASSSESQKKELIKKWRMEKENKRFMDEEQIKMQTRLRKEVEESKRKKRREKIQVALDEYKKKKCLENVLKEMEERSSKERRVYDTTLIKAFREQDKEFTKRRKCLILRSKKPNKYQVNIKRMELVEMRNYSTLLNTTKVWREKCKAEEPARQSNEFRYIKDLPRTRIRWRNEKSEDLKI